MSDSEIITARGVSAGYTEKLVWKDANFSVAKGEFVAIIGPNGAGKTTLVPVAARFDTASLRRNIRLRKKAGTREQSHRLRAAAASHRQRNGDRGIGNRPTWRVQLPLGI